MKFAKERVDVILRQLKNSILYDDTPITCFKVKNGCYITPDEADACTSEEWSDFDAVNMRWYGKDRHY